jgi:LEA14-like dessication related protein
MKCWYAYLLFVVMIASCANVRDPEFRRIDHFGLRKIGLQQATIGFNVTYFNPNNFGVTVKDAAADIYMDSIYLGKFSQDASVDVKKGSTFSVPFSGAISLQTALNLKIEDLARKEILLKADGSAKVGKAGVYVTRPIHYQGRHRLEIRL